MVYRTEPLLTLPSLLVPSKITPPQPGALWVRRERLLQLLGPSPQTRLTLLVAPAGFGKSTLAAQWLGSATQQPVAWLTLDAYDDDGLRVLHHLAGAISQATATDLPNLRPLLTATTPAPLYLLTQALLTDLAQVPTGLTLVLDDYHAVAAAPVHQTFAYLLRHLPEACHLVILTRCEPNLPLVRLRADGQLTELGAPALRFITTETVDLLTRMWGTVPDPASVAALQAQTDGWAIALQLAALISTPRHAMPDRDGTARRQLATYLVAEVLEQQPLALQQAMLVLAIPERISVALAAHMLGSDHLATAQAQAQLSALNRAHLLLALDPQGEWYQFHYVLRDLLLQRLRLSLGIAQLQRLQCHAAEWFAAAHLSDEALQLYLAAAAPDQAADLVEQQLGWCGAHGSGYGSLSYWIRRFPTDLIASRPGLSLIEARRAAAILDLVTTESHLRQVETILADPSASQPALPWPTFHADRLALEGSLRCFQGRPAAALAPLYAALATPLNPWLTVLALVSLVQALAGLGRRAEALSEVARFLPAEGDLLTPHQAAIYDVCRCMVHLHAGELAPTLHAAQRILERCAQHQLGPFWEGYGHMFAASAAYERGERERAASHFVAVAGQRQQVNVTNALSSLAALGMLSLAQGDCERAKAYLCETTTFAAEIGGMFARHHQFGLSAQLALAAGDPAQALRDATEIGGDVHLGLRVWSITPRLSQARVQIAVATPTSLAQAEAGLAACLREVEPLHNHLLTVHCLATQAWLYAAQARPEAALTTLGRALRLAERGGMVQAFVNQGAGLAPLLRRLGQQGVAPALVRRILEGEGTVGVARPVPPFHPKLPELLTRREYEILELLAARWTDKEIAHHLRIAANTVRKHTSTIYGKLGVNDRRAAVSAARDLGLL